MPWGSTLPPAIVKLEHKELDVGKRKEFHKSLNEAIKKRQFSRFDRLLEAMNASGVEMDEVTFSLVFYSSLLAPSGGLALAERVVTDMRQASHIMHPSLVFFYANLLQSLKELHAFDATPNPTNIRKCLKPSWEIARQFKLRRLTSQQAPGVSPPPSDESVPFREFRDERRTKFVQRRSEISRMERMAKKVGWAGRLRER